ncbi:MAG: transposase [Thermodesulfobacteriota bacterium]|nr:transposase [Thermodesulfobacteriota bacterium]
MKETTIVFDHFYIIKLFNDKLSDFRGKLYHKATTVMEKAILKETRWLLIKNIGNLNEDRNEHQYLQDTLKF